jgi:hypothetical protein
MRRLLAAFAVAMTAAVPVLAGQSGAAVDLWNPPATWPPTDSGKPAIQMPPTFLPRSAEDCPRGMPCGLRLLGTVQRNGAVELQVPALRW